MKFKNLFMILIILALGITSVSADVVSPNSLYTPAIQVKTLRAITSNLAKSAIGDSTGTLTNAISANVYADNTLRDISTSFTAYTNTGSTSISKANFDTFIGQVANTIVTCASFASGKAALAGLPALDISNSSATVSTTTNTDITTAYTGTNSSLVDNDSASDVLEVIVKNISTLAGYVNQLAYALGGTPLKNNISANGYRSISNLTMPYSYIAEMNYTIPAVTGTASDPTVSEAEMESISLIIARDLATITDWINTFCRGQEFTALSGSSGGVTSATWAVTTLNDLTAFTHVSGQSDLVGYAEFNTGLTSVENDMSDLAAQANKFLARFGLPLIDDQTEATPNTVITSVTTALTGIDGSSDNALTYTEGQAILEKIRKNLSALGTNVNKLCYKIGEELMIDVSGASNVSVGTLLDLGTASTGGDGSSSTGVSKTEINERLLRVANSIETIKSKLDVVRDRISTNGFPNDVVVGF